MVIIEELQEEEEMSTATTTTFLPQEIIREILSWLPAKSLLRSFKWVCKDLCNLIQDPKFIKIHLSRGAIHRGRSIIRKPRHGNALFQLHHPPPLNCDQPLVQDLPNIAVATNLDFQLLLPLISRFPSSSRLVGSCNGLLCLSLDYDKHIVLLNPTTRKYKTSPNRLIRCPVEFRPGHVTYGFGCFHDSVTTIDEYRVVRIACFYPHGNVFDIDNNSAYGFRIDIYSMSSNSWRWVIKVPPRKRFGHQSSGVSVNGVVHWMGCNYEPYINWDTIVCFDIEDEEFRQLPMAPRRAGVLHSSDNVVLLNWRGYLGMIYCSRIERIHIDLDIWVMKEYGIRESWTREFVIRTSDSDPLGGELPDWFSIEAQHFMTCFWTGDQILIQGIHELILRRVNERMISGRLVLYDMIGKKINEDVLMDDIPYEPRDELADYIDTLVSLNSPLPQDELARDI